MRNVWKEFGVHLCYQDPLDQILKTISSKATMVQVREIVKNHLWMFALETVPPKMYYFQDIYVGSFNTTKLMFTEEHLNSLFKESFCYQSNKAVIFKSFKEISTISVVIKLMQKVGKLALLNG